MNCNAPFVVRQILQAKFCHFGKVDVPKYNELWRMQQAEACDLVRQLLSADRVIHEQQLGWQWQPPEETLFVSPHDAVQANPAATAAAAGTAAGSSSGTRASSWAGGGASAAGSRQASSGGGSIILGLGSPKGSPKASQAGSQHRVSGSRRGSLTSGTGGSARGASSAGGAAAVLQLHSPPEVRADQACYDPVWNQGAARYMQSSMGR
jgi:hypothetical protein